jgi:hypothetical protein
MGVGGRTFDRLSECTGYSLGSLQPCKAAAAAAGSRLSCCKDPPRRRDSTTGFPAAASWRRRKKSSSEDMDRPSIFQMRSPGEKPTWRKPSVSGPGYTRQPQCVAPLLVETTMLRRTARPSHREGFGPSATLCRASTEIWIVAVLNSRTRVPIRRSFSSQQGPSSSTAKTR